MKNPQLISYITGKKLNAFSLRSETKQGHLLLPLLFNTALSAALNSIILQDLKQLNQDSITSTSFVHKNLPLKFRLKLKKVGKTTKPFRYDLNQIPNDYTVKVRNRFKGLDLIDRVPNERRFMTLYRRQGSGSSPRKRNAKKQNGCLRRPYKQLRKEKLKTRRKRKIYPLDYRVPKNSKER